MARPASLGAVVLGLAALAMPAACGAPSTGSGGQGGDNSSGVPSSGTFGQSDQSIVSTIASTGFSTGTTGLGCNQLACEPPTSSSGGPMADCFDCVTTPGNSIPGEGSCVKVEAAAYGPDGSCKMGGVQGCCTYLACKTICDANMNGAFDTQAEWDCFCANDQMGANSQCNTLPTLQAAQTDAKTCLGALVADSVALQAEQTFEMCWTSACKDACAMGG